MMFIYELLKLRATVCARTAEQAACAAASGGTQRTLHVSNATAQGYGRPHPLIAMLPRVSRIASHL